MDRVFTEKNGESIMNKTYHIGEGLINKMHWQGIKREDINAMININPTKFETIIYSLGWNPVGFDNSYHTWQKIEDRSFNQITIPVDKKLKNYAEAMLYAVYDIYLFEDVTIEELVASKTSTLKVGA